MTGSGTQADPYVIWDVTDLQNMNLDPAAYYELGQNINAIATVGWNAGAGFDPVDAPVITPYFPPISDDSSGGSWTVFPAVPATMYDKVDEDPPDEDVTYIQATAADTWALFGVNLAAIPADARDPEVRIYARVRYLGIGTPYARAYIRVAGTNYLSSRFTPLTGGYANKWSAWETDPRTGLPWTRAGLNDIEAFGVYVENAAAGLWVRFTQIRMRIYYGTFSFDGKGHTIRDLHINRPAESYVGLLGLVNMGGRVQNLTLENPNITGRWTTAGIIAYLHDNDGVFPNLHVVGGTIIGDDYVGGVVGWTEHGRHTFIDCDSTADISWDDQCGGFVGYIQSPLDCHYIRCHATGNVNGDSDLGGFLGRLSAVSSSVLSFTHCYATGNVTGSGHDIGGFVGCEDTNAIVFNACFATGNVTGTTYDCGGFVGESRAQYTNCYSLGNVTADYDTGGFVGHASHGSVFTNCYSTGLVTAPGVDVGGFVGDNFAATITNCFWDVQTSGQTTSNGGTGEPTSRMKDIAAFLAAGWDIENHLSADFANGYPFLSWQIPGSSPVWFIFVPGAPPPPVPKVVTLPATGVT